MSANNGLEVIQALEQKPYDLVLLDVQMPEMDGLETTRAICQRWPEEKRPRIIAMTGNALLGDRERCLEAGMDDYISKPIRVGELQAALERWAAPRNNRPPNPRPFPSMMRPLDGLADHNRLIAELRHARPPAAACSGIWWKFFWKTRRTASPPHLPIPWTIPETMAFHAHALRSLSLNLGAARMASLCRNLEESARAGQKDSAAKLLRELEQSFAQTREQLLLMQKSQV